MTLSDYFVLLGIMTPFPRSSHPKLLRLDLAVVLNVQVLVRGQDVCLAFGELGTMV